MINQVAQLEMKSEKGSALSNSPVGRIIVVDDEPELKNILVEALSAQGFEVTGCSSGQQALEELRQREFDLLLTDIMMPKMDGITLLETALKVDPHLIGIMMTGQGTIQTAVDAMKLGAFDYVLKPFRLQILLPVLTRAINTRRLRMENLQLRETVAIHGLCQTIAFTLDAQTVMSKLADAALQQSDADEVSILLPTSDGTELYVAAVRGEKRERLLGERIPLQDSISSWVARERTPLILNGEVHDERFVALWPRPDIRSAVSVPMQVANKLVGIINLNMTNRLRPFTLGQMKALSILASTAAAALESASLYTRMQQAEKNYRSIFENAVEGIFQSTAEGRFITMNPAMAHILGYASPKEAIEEITDIARQIYVDPRSRSESDRIQKAQGVVQGFEFEAYRKDGRKIWLSLNRRSIRDQDGIEIYREGSVENITKRKRAEDALRETVRSKAEALALLDTILSTAPIGFAFHSRDLVYQRINESLASINGLPVEQHLGKTLREVLPEMSVVLEPLLQRVIDTGKPILDLEISGLTPADLSHQHHWLVSFYPVRMQEGELLGVGVLVSEITERKQAEKALRQSEERYRDLVENAHDIIYEHDLDGNYTSINKGGEQITGYSHEETLKLNIADTVAPKYLGKAQEMLKGKLAGEKVTSCELEMIARDGRHIAVEVNTRLVLKDGVPVGVQGIARDVTERKQLEERLRQSQKLEAIGQLAGGVAHDFNNLLTVIGGHSSILLGKLPQDSPHRSSVEEIKKASDRAGGLTRQLLAFSRKQILQPRVLDLNVVVSDLDKMVRRLIGEDIDLLTLINPQLGKVKADPGQIEQILLNLIVNARDAMPNGGKLTIETSNAFLSQDYAQRHAATAGPYVMMTVSDTGCGIDAATQPRIFEPFFTTKRAGKGTGLGLATVYGIVKQSGGNIWLYSELGQGTTFKIYLPRVDEFAAREEVGGVKPVPHGTETVLLVEDESQVRAILKEILGDQGYHVLTASNGEEALTLSEEPAEIQLMITDVVMPQMSGRELAERMTALHPDLQVLFMSGYTDDAIVRHGLLNENLNFIQKPFDSVTVARKVREMLDSRA